ncbi:MAG: hypothetical protein Q9211_000817, partial [Gyalolechia sp. 1 TL-2023]
KSSEASKTTSAISKQAGYVREILELNHLSIDDARAEKTFYEGIDKAKELITEPRNSELSKKQLDDIDEGDFYVPIGWAARDWADDGLDENNNRIFQAGSVPQSNAVDENTRAILKDLPKPSSPQPDIIYGTSIKNLACPFFSVEVKTKGDFQEGVNQACPEGAAMVAYHRNMKALAAPKAKITNVATPTKANTNVTPKNPTSATNTTTEVAGGKAKAKANSDTSKADFSTQAFTMILMPQLAEINVYWVEGLGKRDKEIKVLLNQIHDRYKALEAAKAKAKGKGTSVDGSPESKKRRVDGVDDGDLEIVKELQPSNMEG